MLHNLVAVALRNPRVRENLRELYRKSLSSERAGLPSLNSEVPEIGRLSARPSSRAGGRINLLVPGLSIQHVFGGIATALHFFKTLIENDENARIIVTDEVSFSASNNPDYSGWQIRSLDDEDCDGRVIVCAGDRRGRTLSVREGDTFVATAWWTALIADFLTRESDVFQRSQSSRPFVYLIQDFEPGFYPWSSRYALAESSYRLGDRCIAVFNTSSLQEYFQNGGYEFAKSYSFEPVLNAKLKPFLSDVDRIPRERSVLVYGRPSVARNAFELLVMGLRQLVVQADMKGWSFYSAGESHLPVDLGGGASLVPLGKMSIEEYGQTLRKVYAGLSLMISPHPSYPPLEMAAFGIQVVTNRYANKDLSKLAPNIHTVSTLSPTSLAVAVASICAQYGVDVDRSANRSPFFDAYVAADDPFSAIVHDLRTVLYPEIRIEHAT